jgi:hypothetical protein
LRQGFFFFFLFVKMMLLGWWREEGNKLGSVAGGWLP